jgi:hypothetical protein
METIVSIACTRAPVFHTMFIKRPFSKICINYDYFLIFKLRSTPEQMLVLVSVFTVILRLTFVRKFLFYQMDPWQPRTLRPVGQRTSKTNFDRCPEMLKLATWPVP